MKKKNSNSRRTNRVIKIGVIAGVVLVTAALCVIIQLEKPYAITAAGHDVLLVEDENTAEAVVKQIVKDYAADGSEIESIKLDKNIDIEQKKLWERVDRDKVLSKKEAVKNIKVTNAGDNDIFALTIVGKKTTKEEYTPEVKYVVDDELFAGEEKIEGDTKSGERMVTREITTVNGEVTDTKVVSEKVIKEGSVKTIYRGKRGLPKGEDWKTYKGEPVFDNGTDLMDYSQKFLGVPYVKGGTSFDTGVDCVGFVRALYKYYGVSLSAHLRREGHGVSYSNIKPGDVICYKAHYAVYLGNGKMIHAANPKKDVCIEPVHGGITGVRRIID